MPWEVQYPNTEKMGTPVGHCKISRQGHVSFCKDDLEKAELWDKHMVAVLVDWKARKIGLKQSKDGKASFSLNPKMTGRRHTGWVTLKRILNQLEALPVNGSLVLPVKIESGMMVFHLPAPNTKKPPDERNSDA